MTRYLKLGAIESTYGSGTSGGTVGCRVSSVSQSFDRGVMFEENIDGYLPTTGYGGALKISGTVEGNLRPLQMGTLIEAALGNVSTNTYTLGVPKSLSMSVGEESAGGSHQINYAGVGIKSMNLEFNAKEFVKARFEYLAKTYNFAAFSAPSSYSSEEPLVFYAAAVTLSGSQSYKIKSLNMNIDRKLDDDRFIIGDYTLHELGFTGMTDLGGTMTFTEHEYTEFRRAALGSTSDTALNHQNKVGGPTLVITCTDLASTPSPKMTITAGVSIYSKADVSLTGQSEAEKKIDYKIIGNSFQIVTA